MRKIQIPDEGAESLFGTYDENLKQLESQFGVRIRTAGSELIVPDKGMPVWRMLSRLSNRNVESGCRTYVSS